MRGAHAQIEISDRRGIGGDHMDIDRKLVGMQPVRLLHALQAVKRIECRQGMQDHPAFRIDRFPADPKQLVDVVLFDAAPADC